MSNQIRLRDVSAICPTYDTGTGLTSRVILRDGSVREERRKPMNLLRLLLREDGIDPKLYRKARRSERGYHHVPLVVRGGCFVSFKLIAPRVTGDPVYGYVALDQIEAVDERNDTARVVLRGGHTLVTTQRPKSVREQVDWGRSELALQRAREQTGADRMMERIAEVVAGYEYAAPTWEQIAAVVLMMVKGQSKGSRV
ncbi:hypothetical protein [Ferroacidibacillus organovorans]|uniref:Uncharacterized protein n=1 Tax=Ferroacidibacillus organovorans TaxID=1765683 RepID=A0A1V4EVM2_9BACL|nr:hypothetical protein [Ferroacidibacillus organovorans]OPG16698.1 hypothetical protein B2M26_04875 [Ferroacidibacillus organovorans]